MIKKVLIANRGEIAVRIIKACKEMNIKTVAVYSEEDRQSLHVAFADEAYQIGEAAAIKSYLKIENIITVAKLTSCDAIHPGYGFLSENMEFRQICEQEQLIFIGPTVQNLIDLGDKYKAKQIALNAKVPVVQGNEVPLMTEADLEATLAKLNFPILLKASHGGGGKGIKKCESLKEALYNYPIIKQEAQKAFNHSGIYVEECIQSFMHVEVQIIGDSLGNYTHVGERNCSIQRKMQKLIEETPSPVLSKETREAMCHSAVALAKSIHYVGVGTVEFLYDYQQDRYYFMEMNTRIQVEHPVTEMVSSIDLVKEQLRIASGKELSCKMEEIDFSGYSIECRINAEDPENSFQPSTGKITFLALPTSSPGVRVDTFIYSGYNVSIFYDSLLCKIIVHEKTRQEAIEKMKTALNTTIIKGVKTNISFLNSILEERVFAEGSYDNHYVSDKLECPLSIV